MIIFFWTIFMEYGPQWCIQQGVLCCSKQKLKGESEKLGKLSLSCIHNKQLYCQIGDLAPNWRLNAKLATSVSTFYRSKSLLGLVQNCFMQKQKAELKSHFCFVFNRVGIQPRRSQNKGVRQNPFMLAWVTNVSINPELDIQYSQYQNRPLGQQKTVCMKLLILNN